MPIPADEGCFTLAALLDKPAFAIAGNGANVARQDPHRNAMYALFKGVGQRESDGFSTIALAEVSWAFDADRQCSSPICQRKAVKADVTDEATGINDPGVILGFYEANGGFSMGFCER